MEELIAPQEEVFQESIISIKRVSKVTSGGKRLSFNAMVVVGDKNGKVGCALGKANDVQSAIQSALKRARKNLISVPIVNGTIPHDVYGKNSRAKVYLKPAREGVGLITSNTIRLIAEAAGIQNLIAKVISRASSPINVAYATFDAFKKLRTKEEIQEIRSLKT